jgi:hypothetical protein
LHLAIFTPHFCLVSQFRFVILSEVGSPATRSHAVEGRL